MYDKCRCTCILAKNLRQVTLSPLFPNQIIPLDITVLLYYLIFINESYYQYKIERNRRCNCCSMIHFRTYQRQMSTNDMLVNVVHHVSSNDIHFNNVLF